MKQDLRVLYINSNNVVKLGFGSVRHISKLNGSSNLIQKIIYYLLTEVQSNYYSPKVGSSFSLLDHTNWTPDNQDIIKAGITNSIVEIENKIKTSQVLERLLPEELLNKLEIENIEYSASAASWYVTINVTNLLNQTFQVTL
ncbi:MAG: hypothetical protein ACP5N7_00050 [Candidatus Pacearchaeota archaeon]